MQKFKPNLIVYTKFTPFEYDSLLLISLHLIHIQRLSFPFFVKV